MCGYKVRSACRSDVKQIAELERICFSFPMSEENVEKFLFGEHSLAFVCYEEKDEHSVCAYCGAICVLDEAQILNVATSPQHRRKGLGRLVVQALIVSAEQKGIDSITLEVRETNAVAQNLYKSLGFYEIGMIKKYYSKPTENALILKLDIKNKE